MDIDKPKTVHGWRLWWLKNKRAYETGKGRMAIIKQLSRLQGENAVMSTDRYLLQENVEDLKNELSIARSLNKICVAITAVIVFMIPGIFENMCHVLQLLIVLLLAAVANIGTPGVCVLGMLAIAYWAFRKSENTAASDDESK